MVKPFLNYQTFASINHPNADWVLTQETTSVNAFYELFDPDVVVPCDVQGVRKHVSMKEFINELLPGGVCIVVLFVFT